MFIVNFTHKRKKSISPLIVTILLIVISVILLVFIFTWGQDFVGSSLDETKDIFKDSSLTGFVRFERTLNNVVVLRNYHQTESVTITSYELVSFGDSFWLNNVLSLPSNLELTPGRSISIDLGCIPKDSFFLSLYTTDNRIISVNVPSSANGLNNCSSYSLPVESLLNNVVSGSFEIKEYEITEGEFIVNGTFDTDVSGFTYFRSQINWEEPGFCRLTKNSDPGSMGVVQALPNNKFFKITFRARSNDTVTKPQIISAHFNNIILKIQPNLSPEWQYYEFYGTPFQSAFVLYLSGTVPTGTIVDVDDISVIEVHSLPHFKQGTKYLESITAGTIAFSSNQAYGTWEFDYSRGSLTDYTEFYFCSKNLTNYFYRLRTGHRLWLLRGLGNNLFFTNGNTMATNTWYRIKITRNHLGTFSVYIKGGAFGQEYVLANITGDGTGTNPITNNFYTTSNYFVINTLTGDRITNITFKNFVD